MRFDVLECSFFLARVLMSGSRKKRGRGRGERARREEERRREKVKTKVVNMHCPMMLYTIHGQDMGGYTLRR